MPQSSALAQPHRNLRVVRNESKSVATLDVYLRSKWFLHVPFLKFLMPYSPLASPLDKSTDSLSMITLIKYCNTVSVYISRLLQMHPYLFFSTVWILRPYLRVQDLSSYGRCRQSWWIASNEMPHVTVLGIYN
uniref:Uncharacterized protein n=1 Tax=Physcomitrium patens TaxID=3218 RepID=A0A7I3Z692_PHYPA